MNISRSRKEKLPINESIASTKNPAMMRSNAAQQKNRGNGQLNDMADITDVDIHDKLFLESNDEFLIRCNH